MFDRPEQDRATSATHVPWQRPCGFNANRPPVVGLVCTGPSLANRISVSVTAILPFSWGTESHTRVEKARRSLATARNVEVGGSGGTGRREEQRSTGRGTGPSSAVAVAVCGPSLDLGWNNCNRFANPRREP
jgi:hypothetical protein